jgi:hypothetical protein
VMADKPTETPIQLPERLLCGQPPTNHAVVVSAHCDSV